jgi:hypothetical protein
MDPVHWFVVDRVAIESQEGVSPIGKDFGKSRPCACEFGNTSRLYAAGSVGVRRTWVMTGS